MSSNNYNRIFDVYGPLSDKLVPKEQKVGLQFDVDDDVYNAETQDLDDLIDPSSPDPFPAQELDLGDFDSDDEPMKSTELFDEVGSSDDAETVEGSDNDSVKSPNLPFASGDDLGSDLESDDDDLFLPAIVKPSVQKPEKEVAWRQKVNTDSWLYDTAPRRVNEKDLLDDLQFLQKPRVPLKLRKRTEPPVPSYDLKNIKPIVVSPEIFKDLFLDNETEGRPTVSPGFSPRKRWNQKKPLIIPDFLTRKTKTPR